MTVPRSRSLATRRQAAECLALPLLWALLHTAGLVGAGVAIVAGLGDGAAAGWAWALWVLAVAGALARLIGALPVGPQTGHPSADPTVASGR